METIDSKEEIIANLLTFDSYRDSNRPNEREFYAERLRLGKIFVYLAKRERILFCPSRFAGYKNNTMEKHLAFERKSGSITTPRISRSLRQDHGENNEAENEYLVLCEKVNAAPSSKHRSYWKIENIKSVFPPRKTGGEPGYPDDVGVSNDYVEGAVKQILVNAYERNPKARKACIDHYGLNCTVCDFNFQTKYGVIGRHFIHVHHLMPLATRDAQYQVDPIKDLKPVCPNCHAMLHASDPPFSIEEIQELLNLAKN